PKTIEIRESINKDKIVGIDPGVRTCLVCYDPDGLVIKFGHHDGEKLSKMLSRKRKLISLRARSRGRLKYRLNTVVSRLCIKIENMISDFHRKIANFLCTNYNTIIIPKLNFHTFEKMSKKNKSKMSVWSHCSFVDR